TRGLALWLDAGRLNAARKALGLAEIPDGSRVDTWYDASGHGRHLAQPREGARPLYLKAAIRFDGETSYLDRAGLKMRHGNFTMFIVAAPISNAGGFRAFIAMCQERQQDYTSGANIDQGFGFTGRFDTLNVEGKGFGGQVNLMDKPSDFGVVRRMTISSVHG